MAEIDLSRGVPELHRRALLAPPRHSSFSELITKLGALAHDEAPTVKGMLVSLGTASLGFARAHEISSALAEVRASGVPVICHADEYNNSTYWIAAVGCDRLWASPAGGVDTVGLAAQVLYARKLLGEIKVDVDMLQVGRFKGASEPLTRDGPSDEARESLLGVLGSLRGTWLGEIEKARAVRGLARVSPEQGPFTPDEAKQRGMIDAVGYLQDAREDARERAKVDQIVPRFGPAAVGAESPLLVGLVRVLSGAGAGHDVPHVSVLRAVGPISMGSSESWFDDTGGISQRRMSRILERMRQDKSVRAVVLRIDSPGGSALASDLLWHQLMELRKVKPLVVSVGDMAASGGYYLACAATRILADPTSVVGSIGVVGGKLGIGRGLEHIGVHAEIFAASDDPGARERAAYLSPLSSWDSPTRERVWSTMNHVYELFVRRVSEGRGLPIDQVGRFAEGRIYAGREGVTLGLVDEVGGLAKAIELAKGIAGLGSDAPVRLVGEESGLLQLLEMDQDEWEQERSRAGLQPEAWIRSTALASAPDLLAFAGSFEPFSTGERTLVAMPFAILIR